RVRSGRAHLGLVRASGVSRPGTSKHLRALREAGPVRVRQDARRRVHALRTVACSGRRGGPFR
ncbi:hypothetical protein ACPF8X_25950, partial [Streptomyces sp. G35A]